MNEDIMIEIRKAKNAIMGASKICILSHRGPDGDAVGSNVALRMALENLGKTVVSACVDPIPADSFFLKGADKFVQDFNYHDFDLIISVDCGAKHLVKFGDTKPEIFSGEKPFINIDHHSSNEFFGTINIVDVNACAACFILYEFFKFCDWKITIDIATALLHGIYFDTGSLMHSNTTSEVLMVAGELVAKGADFKRIAKELFRTTEISKLRLWGRILERAYINEEGVVISAVGRDDYLVCGVSSKETSGVIDYLNAVPESRYCVLLSEDEKGLVKGSLRTQRDDVNLSDVASKWGGGGHAKASGFGVPGHLKPIMTWKVVGDVEIEF